MPATTGMKGAGYYDEHSAAQQSTIDALQDLVDDAVASLTLPAASQPVNVMDLGCSEGRNSVRLMAAITAKLRQRTGQPLQTIYSDLPSNNFNQLFANLEEARSAGRFAAGIYASAAGASFYGPVLPPGTAHLATCFNAIQWLDKLPQVPVLDRVCYRRSHPTRPGHSVAPELVAAFSRAADDDLVRFLESRAKELVTGGKLLLATPGDTAEACICDGLYDVINDACLDLVAEGRLKRMQYERLTVPVYFRTLSELLAPLQREGSPVKGAFAIERTKEVEVPTPYAVEFRRSGDVAAYAATYTAFMRAFSEPVVRGAFNQPEGDNVERLYDRIHARLLAEPDRYMFRYMMVAALLTRS